MTCSLEALHLSNEGCFTLQWDRGTGLGSSQGAGKPCHEQVASDDVQMERNEKGDVCRRVAMMSSCNANVTLEPSKWVPLVHKTGHNLLTRLCLAASVTLCLWRPDRAASGAQVLKERFPGVLLVPDICALQSLPAVRLTPSCGI